MLDNTVLSRILAQFGLLFAEITSFYDTSHGEDDFRHNYILDNKYVLKINSPQSIREDRLQEISRLIQRYRSIGVYCPQMIPTLQGPLSCQWEISGKAYTCFVEEFSIYPVCPEGYYPARKEVVAHLGVLAARYSGVDLSETNSMWSVIDLAPLDTLVDEKQENADTLTAALASAGLPELAQAVKACNESLRAAVRRDYKRLPRCVYQGDLNCGNILLEDGHFRGLIDFNMSGTEVNINCFVNETNWFPEEEEFDRMTISEILERMDREQQALLDIIFSQYSLNSLEQRLLPYYKKICGLFQYPNVCLMAKWLKDDARWKKAAELIEALLQK